MKRLVSLLTFILFISVSLFTSSYNVQASEVNHTDNMRAVWIATINNLNYPKTKNNIQAQKNEYINYLNTLQQMGINTVVFQVRAKSDAFYKSSINPWSEFLTGTQGKDPGYDPLEFMIEETHKRGMEFHAWLNPYRVTSPGNTDINSLSADNPARIHPGWVITYNNALYYNPDLPVVRQYISNTVREIICKYDVDAIHFDDYFYPANYPLPAGQTKNGAAANARRENINAMIKQVHDTIKAYRSNVKFGISPIGIWKNAASDPTGSNTSGNESYYSVCADSRTWIKNGYIDYICPQIYWETGNKAADYETLVKWWSNEVAGTNVKLYIGHGVYKDTVAAQIDTQISINKKYSQVSGSFFYGFQSILDNTQYCRTRITNAYHNN